MVGVVAVLWPEHEMNHETEVCGIVSGLDQKLMFSPANAERSL
jgi:hypothetical protein